MCLRICADVFSIEMSSFKLNKLLRVKLSLLKVLNFLLLLFFVSDLFLLSVFFLWPTFWQPLFRLFKETRPRQRIEALVLLSARNLKKNPTSDRVRKRMSLMVSSLLLS